MILVISTIIAIIGFVSTISFVTTNYSKIKNDYYLVFFDCHTDMVDDFSKKYPGIKTDLLLRSFKENIRTNHTDLIYCKELNIQTFKEYKFVNYDQLNWLYSHKAHIIVTLIFCRIFGKNTIKYKNQLFNLKEFRLTS